MQSNENYESCRVALFYSFATTAWTLWESQSVGPLKNRISGYSGLFPVEPFWIWVNLILLLHIKQGIEEVR